MTDRRERFRILAGVLTLMVAVAGWLSTYDQQIRNKFMDLVLLYTGSMFALLSPGRREDDQPPQPPTGSSSPDP